MTGWRIPLRIARREAMRSRGRSLLMLVMIALPVMGVTAADVLIATKDVSTVESLNRRLGTGAAAEVSTLSSPVTAVRQGIDPDTASLSQDDRTLPTPTLGSVLGTLGGHRTGTETILFGSQVRSRLGSVPTTSTELDPTSPLTHGLFRLTRGRWPRTTGEVVINQALADREPAGIRSLVFLEQGGAGGSSQVARTVVGIAESASVRSDNLIVGLPGSIPDAQQVAVSWYIGGGPVTWNDVEKLNGIGVSVLSRDQVLHPSAAARAAQVAYGSHVPADKSAIAVAVLVAVMALIEVVLLAGPAFAVGARRQARSLALLAASGGTPRQARRVVLATGVVIGTVGSAAGVVLGIAGARLVQPVLQGHSSNWFGPFQVLWGHVAAVAGFGLLSALLAAVVPAWIASRQDVVAVLAGRRGDRKPSTRSPYAGLVLVAAGVGLAVAATHQSHLSVAVALSASAICCVLGMVFLVPVVVVGVARLGRHLPLSLRFAVRDAARHRTRTTPAVAAVAASVMGVVALCIGVSSNTAAHRAGYIASLPSGVATISVPNGAKVPWDAYAQAVEREAPGVVAQRIVGLPLEESGGSTVYLSFEHPNGGPVKQGAGGYYLGTSILVYDGNIPTVVSDLGELGPAARTVLASGGAVVFTSTGAGSSKVTVRTEVRSNSNAVTSRVAAHDVNALLITAKHPPATAIIPTSLARRLHLHPTTIELVTAGPTISRAQARNISERLGVIDGGFYASLYVERGFQTSSSTWITQAILIGLGVLLMLGGTLTATFLALSDARPDLATLSAVGAAPRTRRVVAAAYALAVGGVGAVLGAAVGFVPGIAVTYPLTSKEQYACDPGGTCKALPSLHFLDVPWLQIGGVVVLLPLLVALVVWLAARSRLPLVSRLT